jgi:hypothetical protein
MRSTIRDEGSRAAGRHKSATAKASAENAGLPKSRIRFPNQAGLTRCNSALGPGIVSLSSARGIGSRLFQHTYQIVHTASCNFLKEAGIGALTILASVGLVDRTHATCLFPDRALAPAYIQFDNSFQTPAQNANRDNPLCPSLAKLSSGRSEQFLTGRRSGWLVHHSPGDYIDKAWYYCLDENHYRYLEKGQYELLGPKSYVLGRSCRPIWHDYAFRWPGRDLEPYFELQDKTNAEWIDLYAIFSATKSDAIIGDVCPGVTAQSATQTHEDSSGWGNLLKDYIDRGRYRCLDQAQYYYLGRKQYSLLGGMNYLLGHPCYPLWYGYDFYRLGIAAVRERPQWVDFYGLFTVLNEPAEPGDELHAFVAGDDKDMICVGEFIVSIEGSYDYIRVFRDDPLTTYKDGAMPDEMITFRAWDQSAARWYPTEVLYGVPRWTSHGARIRVDINAIPEPFTLWFLGLGALGTLLARNGRTDRDAR